MLIKIMQGVLQFKDKPFKDMQVIFEKLSAGQFPDILFITCSDSRIIPSLLTQTVPGELFIIRNVGNIVPSNSTVSSEAAAIEYAIKVLKIKDIIVCGHSNCGAIKGLLTPSIEEHLPKVASWLNHSHSVLKEMQMQQMNLHDNFSENLEIATKKNIKLQLEHLKTYPLIQEKLASKEVTLHGWFYKLELGDVLIYESSHNDFIPLEHALTHAIAQRIKDVVTDIAMNYLEQFSHPKSAKEYQSCLYLLTSLKDNVMPIWKDIKALISEKLWKEFEIFYNDKVNNDFNKHLIIAANVTLNNLPKFQENISKSEGYHKYCQEIMRKHYFFNRSDTPSINISQNPFANNHLLGTVRDGPR